MKTGWLPILLVVTTLARAEDPRPEGAAVPVALAWSGDGELLVALRDAQAVVRIDPSRGKVLGRHPLGFRPATLAVAEDGRTVWVGGMGGELARLEGDQLAIVGAANGRGPATVGLLGRGKLAVTRVWDPKVEIVDRATGRVERSIALPFAPGKMIRRAEGRWIVADAFGDKLAAVDTDTGKVRVRTLDGVNLRGLAISGDGKELLVSHMAQYEALPVTSTNIDWGLVLSSRLSAVRLGEFDGEEAGREGTALARRRITLDGSRHGAADPSGIAVSPDGGVVMIALSGAHQVLKNDRRTSPALGEPADLLPLGHNLRIESVEVGRNPVEIRFHPDGETVVTADAMSDTISVVRVADLVVERTIPLGPGEAGRTVTQRGEAGFIDGRRALDRWMTCASCHPGGHTNGLNFDTLGDGGYGSAKNTPSLLGVGPTAPYAWTGRFPTLEAQVHQSFRASLQGPEPDAEVVRDIGAYLSSLAPPPALRTGDDALADRGRSVFEARRCGSCHAPGLEYSGKGLKDVGLDDGAGGHRAFNPPSLRGVARSAPYLHDGRAGTMEAVLEGHSPAVRKSMTADEAAALKAFLETL